MPDAIPDLGQCDVVEGPPEECDGEEEAQEPGPANAAPATRGARARV